MISLFLYIPSTVRMLLVSDESVNNKKKERFHSNINKSSLTLKLISKLIENNKVQGIQNFLTVVFLDNRDDSLIPLHLTVFLIVVSIVIKVDLIDFRKP